jgi:hypothetical protein
MEGSLLLFAVLMVLFSTALFYAAKIISVELKFSQSVIVTVVSTVAGNLSGGVGLILFLLAYFGLLKLFTDSSILKIIALAVISLIIFIVAFELLGSFKISGNFSL